MTASFLLEIGCEEIPARFVPILLENLKASLEKQLKAFGLSFESIQVMGTYRRLTLQVFNLETLQRDKSETIFGPPLAISQSPSGDWLPPALGFAKKMNIGLSQLRKVRDSQGRDCVSCDVSKKGRPTADLLAECLPQVITFIPLPIAMRWGTEKTTFIRPIHWIVALLDQDIVPFSVCGISSGRVTYGHRFLSGNPLETIDGAAIELASVVDYASHLEAHQVQVNPESRRALILNCLEAEGQADILTDLIDEIVYLTEWPTALISHFDAAFLSIPSEVLVESMVKNQKYHPLYKEGRLTSFFMVVADNVRPENQETIIKGSTRVLEARLKDAQFFWQEDTKAPFHHYVEDLKQVVYQDGLGSLFDKKERIKKLALKINDDIKTSVPINEANSDTIEMIAELCKADLVTQMVNEFPSLQGIMGTLYAAKSEYPKAVSDGILDHYKPTQPGKSLPETQCGAIVALADRLDTIVSCFQNGLIPTGSQDPHGIRRAIYGVFSILNDPISRARSKIGVYIDFAYDVLAKGDNNKEACNAFVLQRLHTFIMDQGIPFDTASAVSHFGHPKYCLDQSKALQSFRQENFQGFKQLVETAVRVKRLSQKCETVNLDGFNPEPGIESEVWTYFKGESNWGTNEPYLKLDSLIDLSQKLVRYFDQVLVMSDNEVQRHYRLSMLFRMNQVYEQWADFERFEIAG